MRDYTQPRPTAVCDTECFHGYWSCGVKSIEDGRTKIFELYAGHPLDRQGLATILRKWRIYTFNGIKYDMVMIVYAMSGATNEQLKRVSVVLFQFQVPWWTMLRRLELRIPDFIDHVDLMSVSPGAPQMPSLKIYAGRLHSKKMQELPFEPDEVIDDLKREVVRAYHGNDLDVTIDLANDLKAQLALRALMSNEYGVDLRSKSDAQIAEAVIKAEIEKATGKEIMQPEIEPGIFHYIPPDFIKFETPQLQAVLETVKAAKFRVDTAGTVHMPEVMKELRISIGSSVYQMGIGGLHSTESSVSHYSDDDFVLLDRDVTSYYPMIILNCHLFPKHIGAKFLTIYHRIFERRVAAKRSGDKNTAETLKIVLNGSFGKFGSPFSALYSPKLMIQTTITGQLAILMLIEQMESMGFQVVSANTDGFVTKVPRARRADFNAACMDWEIATEFMTEETEYLSLHSRDVNNYIGIAKEKGAIKVKTKGAFASSGPGLPGAAGQKKNPDMDVCTDAVIAYLKDGTPIEETIEWCFDFRRFLTVRRVTGGAEKDGEHLGKALRWYYSREVSGGFVYGSNGNAVPQTIGAKLALELPAQFPADVDHDYYIREAYAILQDIGVSVVDPRLKGRTGRFYGRLPKQKTYHVVDAETGVALCGKDRDSIRDSWIEMAKAPEGRAMCSKCRKSD